MASLEEGEDEKEEEDEEEKEEVSQTELMKYPMFYLQDYHSRIYGAPIVSCSVQCLPAAMEYVVEQLQHLDPAFTEDTALKFIQKCKQTCSPRAADHWHPEDNLYKDYTTVEMFMSDVRGAYAATKGDCEHKWWKMRKNCVWYRKPKWMTQDEQKQNREDVYKMILETNPELFEKEILYSGGDDSTEPPLPAQ